MTHLLRKAKTFGKAKEKPLAGVKTLNLSGVLSTKRKKRY